MGCTMGVAGAGLAGSAADCAQAVPQPKAAMVAKAAD